MGHYTKLNVKIKLKKDTPENVINLIKRIVIDKDLGLSINTTFFHSNDIFKPEFDHEFFKCERWYQLFIMNNFDSSKQSKFYFKNNRWILELNSEFKNYDSEIDHFIDWIKPYVSGRKKKQYIGWYLPEWTKERIYIHVLRDFNIKHE